MPLYLTASHSSRVTKQSKVSTLRRHSSSPFNTSPRTKPISRSKSFAQAIEYEFEDDEKLDATGKILSVVNVACATNVLSAMRYSTENMFCTIPERAGMNSTRISEVLNFQKNLPPIVSLAHVHAIISASSKTEREIASLMATSKLRKIKISGRGNDISGTSEVLITAEDLHGLLKSSNVAQNVISQFLEVLQKHPRNTSISPISLPASCVTALTRAGFLVSSSLSGTRNLTLSGSSLVAMPTISRAASGTSAAVGGEAAFENLGGVGGARKSTAETHSSNHGGELNLSLPNIGPYLRLLYAGRSHLLGLLSKSAFKEAPLYLLREKWDGAVDSDNRVSTAKRIRGEFSTVMPSKTKKWKDLYGLNFDWVLEECLGAGLIELFETKSVGLGVRALD